MVDLQQEFKAENADTLPYDGSIPLCDYLSRTGLFETEDGVINNLEHMIESCALWLQNKNIQMAEHLMDMAIALKDGEFREDGKTDSIVHELTQFIWSASCVDDNIHFENPESIAAGIFCHDLGEEKGVRPKLIAKVLEQKFPNQPPPEGLLDNHEAITKYYAGKKEERKSRDQHFDEVANGVNSSIIKPFDRLHNVITQPGVKSQEGALSYIDSTKQNLITRIRDISAEKFPAQREYYDIILELLDNACLFVKNAYDENSTLPTDEVLESFMPQKGFKNIPAGLHPLKIPVNRARTLRPEADLENAQRLA